MHEDQATPLGDTGGDGKPAVLTLANICGLSLHERAETLTVAEQLQQVLARYVRAIDSSDVDAVVDLFTPEGLVEIWQREADGQIKPVAPPARSKEAIRSGTKLFFESRKGVISHHNTHDLLYQIDGDTARLSAQFTVTRALPHEAADPNAPNVAGRIMLTLTGYYDLELQRVEGNWRITRLRDIFDLPYRLA